MRSVVSIFVSIIVVCSFLILPSIHAVEKKLVKEEFSNVVHGDLNQNGITSFQSFLKKLFGFFEITISVSLAIFITQFLAIRVLPIILEIGFGPVVYMLIMLVLLTIPIQVLNGICLLIQKQFSLSSIQTLMLTIITFLIYIVGIIIVKSSIPLNHSIL
jgi:hypothetical protein